MSLVTLSWRICCRWCVGILLWTGAIVAVFPAAGASCVSMPDGLIAWWPGDGNALTVVGTNNGTLQGGATATSAGFIGNAFTFDGTNSFVQIADSPLLRPTNFTIEAWVRFTGLDSAGLGGSPAGDQYIFFKQNTRSSDFEGIDVSKTRLGGSDYFRFLVSSASGQTAEMESATAISTGVWYHVAAVRGPNFTQLYVNGVLERQTNVSFPQDYGVLPLYFGTSGQNYWDHKFKGNLDEVSFYNRGLSSNEIAAIYLAGNSGKCKAPNIAVQPQNVTLGIGAVAQFAVSATGISPLSYQWRFNGGNIAGATNTSLTISNVQPANAGNYTVIVANSLGSVTSSVAVLNVLLPPNIIIQPVSRTNVAGTDASFSVTASGTPVPGYQWQFNGANITGATDANLLVSNVQAGNAGNYTVVVTNVVGSVTSSVAVLTVYLPPAVGTQPLSRTNLAGTTANFTVNATGTTPLNYQWQFNGANIGGANSSSLILDSVQPSAAGNYAAVITNVAGAVTSSVAVLTVWVPPAITTQPSSRTNITGSDATFMVVATGLPAVSYQWQFEGNNLSGATTSALTINNVQLSSAGNYTVTVTNAAGTSTSAVASLTVWSPPAIAVQPRSITNLTGTSANFSVSATGTAPLSYQWLFNGGAMAGGTSSSLTLNSIQLSDGGNYSVVITNVAGSATSSVAALTVWAAPAITIQPQSATNIAGTTALLTVGANGTAPLSYQWQFNGANINGGTASTLTLNNVQANVAGDYTVTITNVAGAITSAIASLTVWVPPSILVPPVSQTVIAGSNATFSVVGTGTLPLSYQWLVSGLPITDGGNITGATTATLTITAAQPINAAGYSVVITNVGGTVTSSAASLTVNVPPSITTGPLSQTVIAGSNVTITVSASGTLPLSYQWRLYGTNVVNGGRISGATSPNLTISAVQPDNAGPYTVVIGNIAASLTSSPPAQLTVNVPPSITAQPQSLTVLAGSNVTFTVSATGTAPLYYQWRANGLDLIEGPNFVGTTTPTLSIPNAQPIHSGTYSVLVTNVAASVLSSDASLVVVNPDVAVFCDTNLEDVVRLQLGKPAGDITRLDLQNLTFVSAPDSHITCLGGLEWATNLNTLYLGGNLISDISILTNFARLTNLFLPHNLLVDLSPLATLTHLSRLDIRYNPTIANFDNVAGPPNLTEAYFGGNSFKTAGFLSSLNNLTFLEFQGNSITNVDALGNLQNLKGLDISCNPQADFQKLGSLTNLTSLYLSGNAITNPGFLANLKLLTNLSLCANAIADISALNGLANLGTLNLAQNNQLTNYSALSTLTNLDSVWLNGNLLADVSFLQPLSRLALLNVDANAIKSLSPIAGLTNLYFLSAEQNLITNTSGLSSLTSLVSLDLSGNYIVNPGLPQGPNNLSSLNLSSNRIVSVQALIPLTNLKSLDLSANAITDYAGFFNLSNVTSLSLSANSISDISFLEDLPWLSSLDLHGNLIADISPLAALTNLSDLNLANNRTAELSALANLVEINTLDLSSNPIVNWSALGSLTNLTELYLQKNSLDDFSFLAAAPNLEKLDLTFNRFTDSTPLSVFKKLHYLLLGRNRLTEISILPSLPRLWYVDLRTNALDITSGSGSANSIRALTNRQVSVDYQPQNQAPSIHLVSYWPIAANAAASSLAFDVADDVTASNLLSVTAVSSDITVIPETNIQLGITTSNRTLTVTPVTGKTGDSLLTLTVTDEAGLSSTGNVLVSVATQQDLTIPDLNLRAAIRYTIDKLSGALNNLDLLKVTELPADYYGIGDLSGIEWASNLTTLSIAGNSVSNLSRLQSLPNLRSLTLGGNPITDYSQVAILTNLTKLSVAGNAITNYSFINNLAGLSSLDLNNNLVADLSLLATHPNLTQLYLSQNVITNIAPLLSLPNLKYVDLTLNLLDISPGSAAMSVISSLQASGVMVFYVPQRSAPGIIAPTTWRIPANFPSFLSFNVLNSTPPSGSLTLAAASSNTSLIPNTNLLIFQNPDQSWVLKTTPLNQSGTVTVTLGVTDSLGLKGSQPVTVTVLTPGSVGNKFLDNPELSWTTWGNALWFGESSVTHDGISAAQSGHISDNQDSWLGTTAVGPGRLSFWWRVSSETNFDFLHFSINNDEITNTLSGEIDWRQQIVNVPPGTNVLQWRYVKDQNTSHGIDAGWLDEVNLSPGVWLELTGPPTNGQAQLILHAVPGNPYEVQVSTNLVNWSQLIVITPTNTATSVFDNAARGTRFYRLHDLSLGMIYFETPTITSSSIRLVLHSPINLSFNVLSSTNLKDWTTVGTVTNTIGTVQFTNSVSSASSRRFYRAQLAL